jgi:diaminopropionate ammonia-lyase
VLHHQDIDRSLPIPEDLRGIFNLARAQEAYRVISAWPGYAPTPLRDLAGLARQLGHGRLTYKDEAGRFGLGSFKALGGAYAVCRAQPTRHHCVTTATAGNHGRSVAWGAQLCGCRAVIFVPERLSPGRAQEIEALGAELVRVPGTFDDAVRASARAARAHGWLSIPDTCGLELLPAAVDVMTGYTVLVRETLERLPPWEMPTHVIVQAGVGGLAAAVLGYLWEGLGARRPRFIVVEPERADCMLQSIRAGRPQTLDSGLETMMACLACGEPSHPAWQLLSHGADDFCKIPDSLVAPTMRLLATGRFGDAAIVAGESGVAGLALLIAACRSSSLGAALGLGPDAHVLVIGTEGATDRGIYRSIVGPALATATGT